MTKQKGVIGQIPSFLLSYAIALKAYGVFYARTQKGGANDVLCAIHLPPVTKNQLAEY